MPIDYDAMRKQLERETFDKQIQIANSEEQAMKNLGQQVRAGGFGSQGYGATQQSQIRNNSINQRGQVQNDYFQSLIDIDRQEQEYLDQQEEKAQAEQDKIDEENRTNANNMFQTFITDTEGLYGSDFFDRAQAYGFVTQDENGNFVVNTENEMYNYLDQATKSYLQNYLMDANNNALYNQTNLFNPDVANGSITYTNGNGQVVTDTINNRFRNETETVLNGIQNGTIKSGDVISMQNEGDGGVVYLAYRNGNLYYISEEQYNASKGNKYSTFGRSRTLDKQGDVRQVPESQFDTLFDTDKQKYKFGYQGQEDLNEQFPNAKAGEIYSATVGGIELKCVLGYDGKRYHIPNS